MTPLPKYEHIRANRRVSGTQKATPLHAKKLAIFCKKKGGDRIHIFDLYFSKFVDTGTSTDTCVEPE